MGFGNGGNFGNKNTLGLLGLMAGGIATATLLGGALTKRFAFFSFHFDDIMRVNNVRNSWLIDHPESSQARTFFDRSLWEDKQREGDDAMKRLIKEGVEGTSAVCVLVGTETYSRRWVRYEIARSVIDGRGLLAVHINGLNHHQTKTAHPHGANPLDHMGIYLSQDGNYYLYEQRFVVANQLTGSGQWQWMKYADYTAAVSLPKYLAAPQVGYVQPLSRGTKIYDYVAAVGHKNIGAWIDEAAKAAGR